MAGITQTERWVREQKLPGELGGLVEEFGLDALRQVLALVPAPNISESHSEAPEHERIQ